MSTMSFYKKIVTIADASGTFEGFKYSCLI